MVTGTKIVCPSSTALIDINEERYVLNNGMRLSMDIASIGIKVEDGKLLS